MLSEQQKGAVAKWFAAGAGLAEIQKKISEEFGIDMTYLDVRLMVADLPQPAEPAAQDEPDGERELAKAGGEDGFADEPDGEHELAGEPGDGRADFANPDPAASELPQEGAPLAELSVSVDPLAPPGAIACGSVVFSDGTSGKWMLDQMGRLGLSGLPEGYRPSPEDGAQFQPKLIAALRAKGLA